MRDKEPKDNENLSIIDREMANTLNALREIMNEKPEFKVGDKLSFVGKIVFVIDVCDSDEQKKDTVLIAWFDNDCRLQEKALSGDQLKLLQPI